MIQAMLSYQTKFYVPILLLWGAVILATLDPVLVLSDIRLDPYIERNDLLRIDAGGDVAIDDVVIYRLNGIDFVAKVIGERGDEILLGLDGRSIIRNGERVVVAPPGFGLSTTNESGALEVADDEVAVYVQNARRNPVIAVISRDVVRGPVEKAYRHADLGRSEWLMIGLYSLIVLGLVALPFAAFARQASQTLFRLVVLVTHTFLTLAVGGALLAANLPGDPMRVGVGEPTWWWFPLTVVSGFRPELLLSVAAFVALQWWLGKNPWRSGRGS